MEKEMPEKLAAEYERGLTDGALPIELHKLLHNSSMGRDTHTGRSYI